MQIDTVLLIPDGCIEARLRENFFSRETIRREATDNIQ